MSRERIKYYKSYSPSQWAQKKLEEVGQDLLNPVISDIGSGFGKFGPIVKQMGLEWQPFDFVRKIKDSQMWDVNNPAPQNCKPPGAVVMLEVLEHLSNPQRAIQNISDHASGGGFIAVSTPNPFFGRSKISMLFRNQLYAFQPKHLEEHHVFVPLPHVVTFFFNNCGWELLEYGVIGKPITPQFKFRKWKAWMLYSAIKFLAFFDKTSAGPTQVFLFKKER